jgi:hypothetical protein
MIMDPPADGAARDPDHGRVGVFSDPDVAPRREPQRPWTAAEVDGLRRAFESGHELRCPADGDVLDVTRRHDEAGTLFVTLCCPRCSETRVMKGCE